MKHFLAKHPIWTVVTAGSVFTTAAFLLAPFARANVKPNQCSYLVQQGNYRHCVEGSTVCACPNTGSDCPPILASGGRVLTLQGSSDCQGNSCKPNCIREA